MCVVPDGQVARAAGVARARKVYREIADGLELPLLTREPEVLSLLCCAAEYQFLLNTCNYYYYSRAVLRKVT